MRVMRECHAASQQEMFRGSLAAPLSEIYKPTHVLTSLSIDTATSLAVQKSRTLDASDHCC